MGTMEIAFEWPVDDSGYAVVDRSKSWPKRLGPDIVRNGEPHGPLRTHRPLEFHPVLFMDFASLDGSPESCVRFASSFGYLGTMNVGLALGLDDVASSHGEPLEEWQREIARMKEHVETWLSNPKLLLSQPPFSNRLVELTAEFAPGEPDGRPVLNVRPKSLIDAMLLQFGQAVSSNFDVRTCEQCGQWFGIGGVGKRRDARFCSDNCRITMFHNRRNARRKK